MINRINPETLHKPVDDMYTHVVEIVGGRSYCIGGQVPVAIDGTTTISVGDMAGQIREVYNQASMALISVGLTWLDVVHILTFTTDMDWYMREEQAACKYLFAGKPPASTLVEVSRLVDKDWLVEIQIDAVK